MDKDTRNLAIFYAATFVWTWACYLPIALTGNSPYQMPWMILLILGGMGPSALGVLMVLFTYDRQQRGEFWRRCFSPRRIPGWMWLFVFLIFPVIMLTASLIEMVLGGSLPGMEQFRALMAAAPWQWPLAAFISFMSGPWSEEFGWRGYALEPTLRKWGIWRGTIGLGFLWAVWHLPLFFMPATWHGEMGFRLAGFWTFIAGSIGLALLMTWVYLNTNRSILSGMLMHFTFNFSAQLAGPFSDRFEIERMLLVLLVGVGVMVLFTKKALVKKAQPAAAG